MSDDAYRSFATSQYGRYRHWHKVRAIARDEGLDPETAWVALKLGRQGQYRSTPFRSRRGESLVYMLPDHVLAELMLTDQQLAGRFTIDDVGALSSDHRDRYVVSSLMEEAIASSVLEGATTTQVVAKDMLRSKRDPRDKSERMILNNYLSLEAARDQLDRPMSPEFLCELQSSLTRGTLDDDSEEGRFRHASEDVAVVDRRDGQVLHQPPHADELPERLATLCAFANAPMETDGARFIHPIVRAVLLHFMLAYDHPFCDGNGRTARILFYWSVLRQGYWMFEFLPISRLIGKGPSRYGRAFLYTETDQFDATYFLHYHLRIVRQARDELREYLKRKQRQLSETRGAFREDRTLNHRQHALLSHAIRHPDAIYTIESHQTSHKVAYATARADLFKLADAGYLKRDKVGNQYIFTPSLSPRR
ncbi:MAG: Fic family protein [Planctomycetota bacterium]